ncbi:ribonuclease H-like domain-containing protein, partial [Tanacetum coccineum]
MTMEILPEPTSNKLCGRLILMDSKIHINMEMERQFICISLQDLWILRDMIISDITYLLLYVDDIILTTSSSAFLQWVIASLHGEFAMTDLGSLNYFLGIFAQRSSAGLYLSRSTYAEEILEHAHMQKCYPCRTPVD